MTDDADLPLPADPDLDAAVLKRRRAKLFAALFVVVLVGAAAWAAYDIFHRQPVSRKELNSVAEQAITLAIGVPAQLQFDDMQIVPREFDRYSVTGKVEAI